LAIHYRRARNRATAHQHIIESLAKLNAPIRLVEGICVVNVVPKDAPNKADAVRAIQRHFNATQVLYVGDDVTDEDVFRYSTKPSWLGVRVESSTTTAADYFLCRQREIDWLLARLIRLRQAKRKNAPPRTKRIRVPAPQ
jgi:trehalose-phosphatase